ncbi:conidiation-specific protein 10 [Hymenobacter gummosus]|uniref:Conidiation-specific protein 10 n=1 Tax=Hymenobacter gummosus TaxID=1776032 RepID=A0A431U293_9BACT|nr:KGG domain-containing protein [Hymenobacter gummosus]RTQ49301.1 conidiation-specific protein 10 [Hymenobacter gummosus]
MATNNQSSRGAESNQRAQAGRLGAEATNNQVKTQSSGTSRRGFASMDPAEQRRIASEGGKASHASGRGHEWTSAEAREAGRKGGQSSSRSSQKAGNNKQA